MIVVVLPPMHVAAERRFREGADRVIVLVTTGGVTTTSVMVTTGSVSVTVLVSAGAVSVSSIVVLGQDPDAVSVTAQLVP